MLPFDRREESGSNEAAESALGLRVRPLASEMIALEPRMVFDGAAVVTAAEVTQAADASVDPHAADTHDPVAEATQKVADSLTATAAPEPVAPVAPAIREIVFIDSRVTDADAFRAKAGSDTLVVMVGADEDGLSVISQVLGQQAGDISAVHVIGHGVEGAQSLGSARINSALIEENGDVLRGWQSHLTADADILLYGCDVGAGAEGAKLLADLAQATQADVAASGDPVGLTTHGADFSLERTTGAVEAKALAPEGYSALLATSEAPIVTGITDDVAYTWGLTLVRGAAMNTKGFPENLTNDTTPTFSGVGVPNARIRLYETNADNTVTMLVETTVAAAGTFTITPALSQGVHKLHITQTRSGMAESDVPDSSRFNIFIDTTPPAKLSTTDITITDTRGTRVSPFAYVPPNGTDVMVVADPIVKVNFVLSAAYMAELEGNYGGYRLVALLREGDDTSAVEMRYSKFIQPFSSTYFNWPVAVSETRTVYVYAIDSAGNRSAEGVPITLKLVMPAPVTVKEIVDNVSPTGQAQTGKSLVVDETNPPSTNDPTPTLRGTGVTRAKITISDVFTPYGGTPVTVPEITVSTLVPKDVNAPEAACDWQVDLNLIANGVPQAGVHKLTVYQTDSTGTRGNLVYMTFSFDPTPPTFDFRDTSGVARSTGPLQSGALTDAVTLVGSTFKPAGTTITVKYTIDSLNGSPPVELTGTTTVGSDNRWAFTIPSATIGFGAKTIKARVVDQAELQSPEVALQNVFVTGAWSPGGIGAQGLSAWFDASYLANMSIVTVGSTRYVAGLTDLSGNNRDATQTAADKMPELVDLGSGIYAMSFLKSFNLNGTLKTTSEFLGMGSAASLGSLVFAGDAAQTQSDSNTNVTIDSLNLQPLRFNSDALSGLSARSGFYVTGLAAQTSYGFYIRSDFVATLVNPNIPFNTNSRSWIGGITTSSLIPNSTLTTVSGSVNGSDLISGNVTWTPKSAFFNGIGGPYFGKIGLIVAYDTTRTLSKSEQEILANAMSERFQTPLSSTDRLSLTATAYGSERSSAYSNNIGGILQRASNDSVQSSANGGLILTNKTFLTDSASIMFGDNNGSGAFARSSIINGDNPQVTRLDRQWQIDISGGNTASGTVDVSFDIASLYAALPGKTIKDITDAFGGRSNIKLAWRATTSDAWSFIDANANVRDLATTGKITFADVRVGAGNAMLRDGFITIMDGPSIEAISNVDAAASQTSPLTRNNTTFTVTVSEKVKDLTTSSFSVYVTKGSFTGQSVVSVSEGRAQLVDDKPTGRWLYDVEITAGVGAGSLTIKYNFGNPTAVDLPESDQFPNSGGNYMLKTSIQDTNVAVVIDNQAPVATIALSDSYLKLTNGNGRACESLTATISFDEEVKDFDISDIEILVGNVIIPNAAKNFRSDPNNKVYYVDYQAPASLAGAASIRLKTGAGTYSDKYDNLANSASSTDFKIDTIRPKIESIKRLTPGASPTNADTLTFQVTFSEDIDAGTLQAADFVVSGTTATITSITRVSNDALRYNLVLSGGDLANLNGNVSVELAGNADVRDKASLGTGDSGNLIVLPDGYLPDGYLKESYRLDNLGPSVSSVAWTLDGNLKIGETAQLRINFSEAIDASTFTLADLSELSGAGFWSDLIIAADGLSATVTFTPAVPVLKSGTVTVGTDFNDLAGNRATTGGSIGYQVDTIGPATQSITRASSASETTNSDSIVFQVTFSEDVRNVDSADFVVTDGAGAPLAGAFTISVAAGANEAIRLVTVSGAALASYNGRVGLAIASGVTIDDKANGGGPGNALSNAQPATAQSYLLDNNAPAVTFTAYEDNIGPSKTDFGAGTTTDDNLPLFKGTVEAGASVEIYEGTTRLGLATVTGTSWSFQAVTAMSEGAHTLRARATDAAGNTAEASFAFTVKEVNSAPAARDDAFKTIQDQPLTITAASLLGNDTDADTVVGQTISFNAIGSVTGGTAVYRPATNDILFTPTKGFSGAATFTYTVMDSSGAVSNSATVTITVSAVTGAADVASVRQDQTVTKDAATGVLSNDSGAIKVTKIGTTAADQSVSATGTSVTTNYGVLTMFADGRYSFLANGAAAKALALNATAQQVFTYEAANEAGGVAQSTLTITITGDNDAAVVAVDATVNQDLDVIEAGGTNNTGGDPSASGKLKITDVDTGQAVFGVPTSLTGTYGAFTFNAATGEWTYALDNTRTATQALKAGPPVSDTLTVFSSDGSSSYVISVNVTGTNDNAVIATDASVTEDVIVTEAGGVGNATAGDPRASGKLRVSDVDGAAKFVPKSVNAAHGAFTIDADGVWSYTLNDNDPAVQALNVNGTLTDAVSVSAEDGTQAQITITIKGANDAAVISGPTFGSVTEKSGASNGTAGTATATGTLSATDVDNTTTTFTQEGAAPTYGSFSITGTGAWTYTLNDDNGAVQALNAGQTLQDRVTVKTADGTTQQITITINGANDAAVISGTKSGSVTAKSGVGNATGGVVTATGTLSATDVDNTATTFTHVGAAPVYGSFTIAGTGGWTYTLSDTNTRVRELKEGETLQDQVTVQTADGTTQLVTITITGVNDKATISIGPGADDRNVTEAGNGTTGVPRAQGTLTVIDVDPGEAVFKVPDTLAGRYGTFTFDATTGAWSYTLDNTNAVVQALLPTSERLTDTLTVKSLDLSAQHEIAITITGANDAAAIAVDTTVNEDRAVTEAGANNTGGDPSASGKLKVTDVDTGQAVFGDPKSLAGTYGAFTFNAATGDWTYTLDNTRTATQALKAGEGVNDTLTVFSSDSTASYVISVNVTGANDAAVIAGTSSGSVTEKSGASNGTQGVATAAGTLSVSDVDKGESGFGPPSATNLIGTYGAFTFNAATGAWTYTLDEAKADVLRENETKTETLTVSSLDGTEQQIRITVNGANDTAVIGGTASGSVTERSGAANGTVGTATAAGTLSVSDVDKDESGFRTPSAANLIGSYGAFTFNAATGAWTYTLDEVKADALRASDTWTETLNVLSLDLTQKQITVTVNGANDAAVIGGTLAGTVKEKGGVKNNIDGLATATGTLTVSDVDGVARFKTQTQSTTYGSFSIGANGVWTYTLDDTNDHVQALNAGGTLDDDVTVTADDGTTSSIRITIQGADDFSDVTGDTTGTVTEAGGAANATPGVARATGTLKAAGVAGATKFTPQTDRQTAYGSFSIDANGAWTYTLNNNNALLQALNEGDKQTEVMDVAAEDGSTAAVTITVIGANDNASIAVDTTVNEDRAVTEAGANNTGGDPSASGKLKVTDVDTGQAVFGDPKSLAGTYGAFTFNATTGDWTYTLDNTRTATQALKAGEGANDKLTVFSRDGTASYEISVDITGANDDAGAIAGTSSGSVTEKSGAGNGTPGVATATGTLSVSDIDKGESVFFAPSTESLIGAYGAFTFNAATGAWTYTLDEAKADVLQEKDTRTERLTVSSLDRTATKTIEITVIGKNDAAAIVGTSSGSVTESGGVSNGTAGTATAAGKLTVSDADLEQAVFQDPSLLAGTYGAFTFDKTTGDWRYTLDNDRLATQALKAGQEVSDTLTVYSSDRTAKQEITVKISGANDAPVIDVAASIVTASLTESGAALSAAGRIVSSDIDSTALTASLGAQSVVAKGVSLTAAQEASLKGGLKVQADGTWSYGIASPDYLPAGATVTISAPVIVTDAQGATATQIVTVTITGTNDAPVAAASVSVNADEDATINGAMGASDVDGDVLSYAVKAGSGPAHGALLLDAATGRYTYTPAANYNGADSFTLVASDGKGGAVEQTVSIALRPVNDAPVGGVNLDGIIQIGQTLTASNTLADVDGLGPITYQWLRNGIEIAGATGASYTLAPVDSEASISVRASYVDLAGTREQATSSAVVVPSLPVPQAEPDQQAAAPMVVVEATPARQHLRVIDTFEPRSIQIQDSPLTFNDAIYGGRAMSSAEMLLTSQFIRGSGDTPAYNGFMFQTIDRGSVIELRVLASGRMTGDAYSRLTENQYTVSNETALVDKVGSSIFVLRSERKASIILLIKQGDRPDIRVPIVVDTVRGTIELNDLGADIQDGPSRFSELLGEEVEPGMNALLASLAFLHSSHAGRVGG